MTDQNATYSSDPENTETPPQPSRTSKKKPLRAQPRSDELADTAQEFYPSSHPSHPALWILTWVVLGASSSYAIYQWHQTRLLLANYEARLETVEGKTDDIPLFIEDYIPDRQLGGVTFDSPEADLSTMANNVRIAQEQSRNVKTKNLDEEFQKTALQAQLLDVGDRIEQLERKLTSTVGQSLKENRMLLGVIALHKKIQSGGAYRYELENLMKEASQDPAVIQFITPLNVRADVGIPNRKALYDHFTPLAREIIIADYKAGADEGLIGQVKANVSEVVTVRRIGEGIRGTEVDAIVGRAEAALKNDNLANAIQEISKLQGNAATVAESWLADARALAQSEEAFTKAFDYIGSRGHTGNDAAVNLDTPTEHNEEILNLQ
ncbi:MAG: hypothetical protein K0R63_1154 [Rickettsiales bacterium]|jgi:hypothetical protein|nr:hypothetical protein [Rickettsiales bacterium]